MTLSDNEDGSKIANPGCARCRDSKTLNFPITMAFQPIVDILQSNVFAYEALVRGVDGTGAGEILAKVDDDNRYIFDQTCRVKAIEIASRLGLKTRLSINFLPNAVYNPDTCIRATMKAAKENNFPVSNIIFEVTESEPVRDPEHLQGIFDAYADRGFITAIDDFGAGFAGLNLLNNFKPKILKIDMGLCRGIASNPAQKAIVKGILSTAHELNILVIAEGIEEVEDYQALAALGIRYMQGFLFARPQIETLPEPDFSALRYC